MSDGWPSQDWHRDARVAEILDEAPVLHVAVAARSGPHVTPAVFDVDGGRLWFVTPRRSALLDGPAVVEAWGRWPRADLLLRGPPLPGTAPDLSALPPALRPLLADDAAVVLGWQTLAGPLALPARWRAATGGLETSGEALILAGGAAGRPACVPAQRARYPV